MGRVHEFTGNERWIIQATINERYRTPVAERDAGVEVRLFPCARERPDRPAALRSGHGENLAIIRTGDSRLRCQFCHRGRQMCGIDPRSGTTSPAA